MGNAKSRLTNNGEPFKIHHKFRDKCLVPDVAIDVAHRKYNLIGIKDTWGWHNAEFITTDGVKVTLEYVSAWMGDCQEVDYRIKRMYKHSIDKHKQFYFVNNSSSCWYYIKMVKI